MAEREAMEFDVVVVGAGPAGLAAAIRLKQLAPEATVCVVEKGSEVGAHILSGAVIEPRALDELLPGWRSQDAPLTTEAKEDRFLYLTARRAIRLPTPPQMHNHGNRIGSLGDLCRWLAGQAEALGVEVYPGFAAAELLEQDGRIVGVATGDMGVEKSGERGPNYQPGMELRAAYTLFAEGCRGSLSKRLMARQPLAVIRAHVSDVLVVPERVVEDAISLLAEGAKQVAEGAGAVGVAALLAHRERFAGKCVGTVVCGGNIDSRILANVLLRGLLRDGRLLRLHMEIPDRPGVLADIAGKIGNSGGNIIEVSHQRLFAAPSVQAAELEVMVEARDPAHAAGIAQALAESYVVRKI